MRRSPWCCPPGREATMPARLSSDPATSRRSPVTRHYLDHASTSPPRPEVVRAMVQWLEASGPVAAGTADPGRVHTEGRIVRAVIEEGRQQVATVFGTRPRQVVFTSGGTEAVNAAIWG